MDFSSNSEIDEDWNRDKIYKVGLKDQFEMLQIGVDYDYFVRSMIAGTDVPLGISFPNFDRSPPSRSERNRWFNIAVRMPVAGLDYYIVFMCDLDEYKPKNKEEVHRFFRVKGITTLDKGTVACGEIQVTCDVFTRLYFQGYWSNVGSEDVKYLSDEDMRRSVLSIDFLSRLSEQFVVKEPQKVLDRLSKWGRYLDAKKEIMEKDLGVSYSVDERPEVFVAYYKADCSEEEKEESIPFLRVKDRNGVWSFKELPGSEKAPLVHIVHDFLKKDYDEDPSLRKKFESFTSARSLILSEELVFEDVKRGKSTERRPVFKSKVGIMDGRISSRADEEVIPNKAKIDNIIREGKEAIERMRKETEGEREREFRSLMSSYESETLPPLIEEYKIKERERRLPSCIAVREERIAKERSSLEASISSFKSDLDAAQRSVEDLRRRLESEDDLDESSRKNIESSIGKIESEASGIRDKMASAEDRLGRLGEIHDLDSIVEKTISPFVSSYRSGLMEERRDVVDAELRVKYENIFKAREEDRNRQTEEMVETVKLEETRMRLHVFYRLDTESAGDPESISKSVSETIRGKTLFLYKDPSGDMSIMNRQRAALDNLRKGYVMNPFLASALFDSSSQLFRGQAAVDRFYSKRLNEKQKEAIRKAVASNGMFLIRGPPGTGKTEVIAEITAQLVTRNKKVLIASENHKAVDNAFLRLPEIPTLRRVRLFGGYARKREDSNPFSANNQTRIFYRDIAKRLEGEIQKASSSRMYSESIVPLLNDLKDRAKRLRELESRAQDLLKSIASASEEMDRVNRKIIRDREENSDSESRMSAMREAIDSIRGFEWDDAKEYVADISISFEGEDLTMDTVRSLYAIGKPEIRKEYRFIDEHRGFFDLLEKRATASESDAKAIEIEMLSYQSEHSFNVFEFKMAKLFPRGVPQRDAALELKEEVDSAVEGIIADIEKKISEEAELCNDTSRDEQRVRMLERDIQAYRADPVFKAFEEAREALDSDIRRALSDNNILGQFKEPEEGIGFLEQEVQHIRSAASSGMSQELQAAYGKMAGYLRDEGVVEKDSEQLNDELLDYANVIGLTCTTSDSIKTDAGTVDLKRANIDVVIVDEVSKVSFLEVLYPILYGKTVILVGDDKQLPPIYQSNVLDGDYSRYDPGLINKNLEDEFRRMYETSFFKELYRTMPECNKTMLTVQYRMHPHIMDADNIFYGNQLTYGGAEGNREHYLEVKGGFSRNIISKDTHLVFVDVDGREERGYSGGRSRINQREADVVVSILRKMEYSCTKDAAGEDLGGRKFTKDYDPRLSLGVICGYSDQAKLIRRSLKGFKFQSFNRKDDEQFMVDTVDNFQGDERDIIVLSLVATNRLENSFMKVYNRINVAISRARCLLVIVGNGRAFSNLRTEIDGRNDFVYRRIVDQAKFHRGYITERDVMGE